MAARILQIFCVIRSFAVEKPAGGTRKTSIPDRLSASAFGVKQLIHVSVLVYCSWKLLKVLGSFAFGERVHNCQSEC